MAMDFPAYLRSRKEAVDAALDGLLPAEDGPAATIAQAMRYAVFGGGKRLRPILALAGCEACGAQTQQAMGPAAAMELIHTYSLVHDDLPAMDDDDLRRGRATVHKAYGDAEAILAGDALQCLAFELLATRPEGAHASQRRQEAVLVVARAAGLAGMVGGQIADIEAERRPVDGDRLNWIHRHKTGALIAASAEIGAIHAGADSPARASLSRYGQAIGLAFQVADDLLDRTSTAAELGKTPGKDDRSGKATYPGIFGVDESRRRADELVAEATGLLRESGLATEPLLALAEYAVARSR
jgi:geranylgeranyl diphosphate synthase type II